MDSDLTLTTADLSKYGTVFDPTTLTKKGLCPVSKIKQKLSARQSLTPTSGKLPEEHSLYYEVHGKGSEKILFIMGLNGSSFSFQFQVDYLAKAKNEDGQDKYSVLVFDNRGVGNSDSPKGPYSTSGMAQDVIHLLDYVGWTRSREVNVVGVSLGGMIALELASVIPDRLVSMALCVTSAGGHIWQNLPPWIGTKGLTRLVFTPEMKDKIPLLLPMTFPEAWLNAPVDEYDQDEFKGLNNYETQKNIILRRVPVLRKQTLIGALSQMAAGLTHYVSKDRLKTIASNVPKIVILSGDEDHLVRLRNSEYLSQNIPGAEYIVWPNTGHAVHTQRPKKFSAMIEKMIAEGRQALATS